MAHTANNLNAGSFSRTPDTFVPLDEHAEVRISDSQRRPVRPAPNRLIRDRQTLLHWIRWTTSLGWVLGLLYLLTTQPSTGPSVEYRVLGAATVMLMLIVY
ncbi:MAG: hypothetical protein EA417_13325 [Gammaproteobacteria bacterium]|nr:MAG: hypothetical protein EA417_13325 [Gammaproteobacteria bacterium]